MATQRTSAKQPRSGTPSAERRAASQAEPPYEQIADAAYHRYLQRGGRHGADFEDWLDAERGLKDRTR